MGKLWDLQGCSLCSGRLVVAVLFMDLCLGMIICERSKEDGASNNTAAAVHQHKWTHRTVIITIRMTPTVKRKHQRFPLVTNVTDFSLGMPQHFITLSLAFRNDVLRFYRGQTASTNCFFANRSYFYRLSVRVNNYRMSHLIDCLNIIII
jgi:hypothetical protein